MADCQSTNQPLAWQLKHRKLAYRRTVIRSARLDGHFVDDGDPSVNGQPGGSDVHRPPLLLVERTVDEHGVRKRAAERAAIYRQRPRVMQLPTIPHECWRIALQFTVGPDFAVTVWRRRRFGVKF